MKYILSHLIFMYIFMNSKVFCQNDNKIVVSLYYEASCSDSMRFVINQLAPNYDYLFDLIDLQMYPFGFANKTVNPADGSFTFWCRIGSDDCLGNKLHSCVVEKYFENQQNRENKLKTVQFLNCSFSADDWRTNVTNAVLGCYQSVFGDDFDVYKCAAERGIDLLDRMGNETNKLDPKLDWVPWITFNNVRNKESELNFLESVCNRTACNSSTTNNVSSFLTNFIIIIGCLIGYLNIFL